MMRAETVFSQFQELSAKEKERFCSMIRVSNEDRTETVTISKKELECLRKHLDGAMRIFRSLGIGAGDDTAPATPKKRVPFQKGVENYMKLLESREKRTLPAHLKTKKPAGRTGNNSK